MCVEKLMGDKITGNGSYNVLSLYSQLRSVNKRSEERRVGKECRL